MTNGFVGSIGRWTGSHGSDNNYALAGKFDA